MPKIIEARCDKPVGTTAIGMCSVEINGEIKHISELAPERLSAEFRALRNELNDLYKINQDHNTGLRGIVLRMLGVHLPDRYNIVIGRRA